MKSIIMQTKFIFLLLSLFLCISIYAQDFAYVSDPDGYVNVRANYNVNSDIIDKLPNGTILSVIGSEGNWLDVDYQFDEGNFKNGTIYYDRIKFIKDFEKIPVKSENENSLVLDNKDISIKITIKKFDKNKHHITSAEDYPNQILEIDHMKNYGFDGLMPQYEYDKFEVQIGREKIIIPDKATKSLYEPNLFLTQANYDKENDTLYIFALNSDGAGGYNVLWIIKNGEYVDRYIASGF